MEARRWFNQSLPQMLQIAVFLLYLNGFFLALRLVFAGPSLNLLYLGLVAVAVGYFFAGTGIASEQRTGYMVGFAVAVVGAVFSLLDGNLISLMFDIALVALLMHPQSQEHQRIWFH